MQNELQKVLDYKNQNYEIIGEFNEEERKNLLEKYSVSPFFRFRRFVKKTIFFFIKLFLKRKLPLIKSRSLKSVESKYDKIAGEYIQRYLKRNENIYPCDFGYGDKIYKVKGDPRKFLTTFILNILETTNSSSFMEIGAGELINIFEIQKKNSKIDFYKILALDISLPRLVVGNKFLEENSVKIDYCINSNAEKIPLSDNSIDLLFTIHCLEQVPNLAKNIIKEMLRVAKKYVVLIEPSIEYGSEITRKRIYAKDYVKLNNNMFKDIDAEILYRRLNRLSSYTSSSEIVILKKKSSKNFSGNFQFNPENKAFQKKDGVFIFN